MKKEEQFWRNILTQDIKRSYIPYDFKCNANYKLEKSSFILKKNISDTLLSLSNNSDINLFSINFAIVNVLISYLSYNDEIIVQTPIFKQENDGDFVNTILPIKTILGQEKFKDLVVEIKQNIYKSNENINFPIATLIEQLNEKKTSYKLIDIGVFDHNLHYKKYIDSLNLNLIFAFNKHEDCIEVELFYNSFLYSNTTSNRILEYLKNFIIQFTCNPKLNLSEFNIDLSLEEKNCFSFKEQVPLSVDSYISLFDKSAKEFPNKKAIIYNTNSFTYSEVYKKSIDIATYITQLGITSQSSIGICMSPSIELICSILGVLRAGCVFVPIDYEFPEKRINYILNDCNAQLLITNIELYEIEGFKNKIINIKNIQNEKGIVSEFNKTSPDDLAYIIYTSGTTGYPKGVQIKNKGLVNYVDWFGAKALLNDNDSTILLTSIAYDLCYTSVFPILSKGGELHILNKGILTSITDFLEYINKNSITYLKFTPTILSLIINNPSFKFDLFSLVRLVVLGGEPVIVDDIQKLYNIYPNLKIMNHYGPTECTIGCLATYINKEKLDDFLNFPHIGKPINNTKALILNKNKNILPFGAIGDLYISGIGLSRGYINLHQLTEEKFIKCVDNSEIIYDTGDLALLREDGNIIFIGRKDEQMKFHGYRIEPKEIENVLKRHDSVNQVFVDLIDQDGKISMVAYVVAENKIEETELRKYLLQFIPASIIPEYFILVDVIPYTLNGKINKKELSALIQKHSNVSMTPRTEEERTILSFWKEELKTNDIGIQDNFFHQGGDSIRSIRIINMINKHYNLNLNIADIYFNETIEKIAQVVKMKILDKESNNDSSQLNDISSSIEKLKNTILSELK